MITSGIWSMNESKLQSHEAARDLNLLIVSSLSHRVKNSQVRDIEAILLSSIYITILDTPKYFEDKTNIGNIFNQIQSPIQWPQSVIEPICGFLLNYMQEEPVQSPPNHNDLVVWKRRPNTMLHEISSLRLSLGVTSEIMPAVIFFSQYLMFFLGEGLRHSSPGEIVSTKVVDSWLIDHGWSFAPIS